MKKIIMLLLTFSLSVRGVNQGEQATVNEFQIIVYNFYWDYALISIYLLSEANPLESNSKRTSYDFKNFLQLNAVK